MLDNAANLHKFAFVPVAGERRQERCFWGHCTIFCLSFVFHGDFEYFKSDRMRVTCTQTRYGHMDTTVRKILCILLDYNLTSKLCPYGQDKRTRTSVQKQRVFSTDSLLRLYFIPTVLFQTTTVRYSSATYLAPCTFWRRSPATGNTVWIIIILATVQYSYSYSGQSGPTRTVLVRVQVSLEYRNPYLYGNASP